jgi:hypothetical protein
MPLVCNKHKRIADPLRSKQASPRLLRRRARACTPATCEKNSSAFATSKMSGLASLSLSLVSFGRREISYTKGVHLEMTGHARTTRRRRRTSIMTGNQHTTNTTM